MLKMVVEQGDITQYAVDAVVNAANTRLLGGGGVDGAIHRAAGPELLEECRTLNGCSAGDAKITKGYKLSARYIIHTAGPVWRGGRNNETELLASCYRRCLEVAAQNKISTIAVPCISTGAYRFPKVEAAEIAVNTVADYLEQHSDISKVIFVCFFQEDVQHYEYFLRKQF